MAEPRCIRYLRDYVAIPSVNPMQREDIPPEIAGERRYAEAVREKLRAIGVDAELIGDPERPSVIGAVTTAGASETVMVASHLDTVPVDGMEIDPFDPRIEGHRMFGRGTCDTKAGMAALIDALEHTLTAGTLRRNLIVVGESDEELGSLGAIDVANHVSSAPPDWTIATEPTSLRVVTRHKGVLRARLCATGVSCHSSDPGHGRNAIVALARAVLALESLGDALGEKRHPLLGPGTQSIGVMAGGSAANIVPDAAWCMLDRRLLPGETDAGVRAEIESTLAREEVRDVAIEWIKTMKPSLETPDDSTAVRACQAALAAESLSTDTDVVAFGTDAAIFAERGIPGVVWGPGSIDQAHTAREWVDLREVEGMAVLYRRLLETS